MRGNCHGQGSCIQALKAQPEIDKSASFTSNINARPSVRGFNIFPLGGGVGRGGGGGAGGGGVPGESRAFSTGWCCHALVEVIPETLGKPEAFTVIVTVSDDCDPDS